MWPYLLGPKSVEKFPNQETKYIHTFSICPAGERYRCEVQANHKHGTSSNSTLNFESILTKVVSGDFSKSHYEGQKGEYFCSNSKNGCEEEFLALRVHDKSCTELEQEFLTLIF